MCCDRDSSDITRTATQVNVEGGNPSTPAALQGIRALNKGPSDQVRSVCFDRSKYDSHRILRDPLTQRASAKIAGWATLSSSPERSAYRKNNKERPPEERIVSFESFQESQDESDLLKKPTPPRWKRSGEVLSNPEAGLSPHLDKRPRRAERLDLLATPQGESGISLAVFPKDRTGSTGETFVQADSNEQPSRRPSIEVANLTETQLPPGADPTSELAFCLCTKGPFRDACLFRTTDSLGRMLR